MTKTPTDFRIELRLASKGADIQHVSFVEPSTGETAFAIVCKMHRLELSDQAGSLTRIDDDDYPVCIDCQAELAYEPIRVTMATSTPTRKPSE